jgi:hypothetical protein
MARNPLSSLARIAACVGLLAAATTAFAQNHERVLPITDPAYGLLDRLFLEQGLAVPFQARPCTEAAILHDLARIDRSRLSEAGRRAYGTIMESVSSRTLFEEESSFAFNASAAVTAEVYEKADDGTPSEYGYPERKPVFNLPVEFWLFQSVYANLTATLKEDHRLVDDPSIHSNLFFAQPAGFLNVDWYWPFRAFFSVGGPNWYLQFGRDKLDFGSGMTGNLLISDAADYHDFGRFTAYWDRFMFTAVYLYLEPWLTPEEQAIEDTTGFPMRIRDYKQPYKAVYLHRFDLKVLKRINVFFTEAILFGSMYPQIRDFNPLMVFHNWFEYERSKDVLEIGVEVNPFKYVNLHGSYLIWESETAYEKVNGGDYPGAYAYLAGATASVPAGPGYVEGGFEYVRTDPWLYNRYDPRLKWLSRRRIWSYVMPDGFFYYDEPLGYVLGPDAIRYAGNLGYSVPGIGSGTISFDYVQQGPMTTSEPYPGRGYINTLTTPTSTPTEAVENRYVLHFGLKGKPLAPLALEKRSPWIPRVELSADLYRVWIKNLAHVPGDDRADWQFAGSVKVEL